MLLLLAVKPGLPDRPGGPRGPAAPWKIIFMYILTIPPACRLTTKHIKMKGYYIEIFHITNAPFWIKTNGVG